MVSHRIAPPNVIPPMPSALLPPLIAAIEPIAAYVNRTPTGNKHADHCEALVTAAIGFADAVEAEDKARALQPDWRAIAAQMVAYLEFPPSQHPLALRVQRQLAQPHLLARAAQPLAYRMLAASVNSHHLGTPDLF